MKFLTLACIVAVLLAVSPVFAQAPLGNGTNFLTCVNYNDGPTSSDMTLVVQLEIDGKIVVDEGHAVKYLFLRSDGELVGMDWAEPSFNDSAWEDGISGVGYSDGDDNTEVKRENEAGARDGLAIYTRYRFEVADSSAVSSVILRADYDDAYAAWLNGEEIARSANLAGKDLTWDASAGGVDNHGSTEAAAGTPNPDRQYQEEVEVDFVAVDSVVTAVELVGKLATSWGKIKSR